MRHIMVRLRYIGFAYFNYTKKESRLWYFATSGIPFFGKGTFFTAPFNLLPLLEAGFLFVQERA